jgi:transposase-like protein
MVSMNKLTIQKRVQILASLVEGNSIRSTLRMTGAAKNTVVKLLRDSGQVCEEYQRLNILTRDSHEWRFVKGLQT